jgi:hypothetical protein
MVTDGGDRETAPTLMEGDHRETAPTLMEGDLEGDRTDVDAPHRETGRPHRR